MSLPEIFQSKKFQAAFIATVLAGIPVWFTLSDKTASRADKQHALEEFVRNTAIVWGVAIGGQAWSDVAANKSTKADQTTQALADINARLDTHSQQLQTLAIAMPPPKVEAEPPPNVNVQVKGQS